MSAFKSALALVGCLSLAPWLIGCGHSTRHEPAAAAHDLDHHDHHELGPHGGELIELGNENYHAELMHDDQTHEVTIYLLDRTARRPAPEAQLPPHVIVNVLVDGAPRQFQLPRAQGNRYSLVDEALCDGLCGEQDVRARLNAQIGGKTFVGNIEAHEHDGHEHHHAHAGETRIR